MTTNRLLASLVFSTFLGFFGQNLALGATSGVEFRVSGVLISNSSQSALVNGKLASVGDRVDGIEILSIGEDGVRVLSGSTEYTLPIGARAVLAPSAQRPPAFRDMRTPPPGIRRVRNGDTLSEIAEDYAGDGASLNQVMVALFEANPRAFAGNINQLRAGAILHIPAAMEFQQRTSEAALAEVSRQIDVWQQRPAPTAAPAVAERPAERPPDENRAYGPIRFGETLSEIAAQLASDDVPMQRMMTALFEANPHAFGSSMDLLREGAVLDIPFLGQRDAPETVAANIR